MEVEKSKLFVGNLSYGTTVEKVVELFSKYGEVVESYKPEGKGFAFIKFKTEDQATAAMEALNGSELDGRQIVVNVARPREERPRSGFGGGGSGQY